MARPPNSPHDAPFGVLFGNPDVARLLVPERLPTEVADMLAPDPKRHLPGSWIDSDLVVRQADVPYRGCLRKESPPDQIPRRVTRIRESCGKSVIGHLKRAPMGRCLP